MNFDFEISIVDCISISSEKLALLERDTKIAYSV